MFALSALHKAGVLARQQGGGRDVEEVLRRGDCNELVKGGGGIALRPGFRYGKPIVVVS
jgi:hypothetical protein